ncbi:WcaF family extracellular polysaccharide biosynthesis acetyltransferase [Roseibacillus persicicus]|uniref:Acetyltransferase n=1 Tax=Roseibacillus persicicus TaxID=454148 RepID=A0A918TTL2_9BACT|nr:WcaF family extracellular polysaccharide biosynthesis acetyltransferase [Roseibacillus persicicus]GHC61365.1 acetyltransferase [Roseibacillus persicicus]
MKNDTVNKDTFTGPSFSFENRLLRFLWILTWNSLGGWTPIPFFAWRSFLLKRFGAQIGKGVHVYPKVKVWAPWNIALGDEVGVGNGAILYSQDRIEIGNRAVISQGAHLCTGTHDYDKQGFPLVTKPIVIGSNVWVAAEAFVHPGVKIGDGSVVGARSVVTKDLPAWMVCSGFPAKPLKMRKNNNNI